MVPAMFLSTELKHAEARRQE